MQLNKKTNFRFQDWPIFFSTCTDRQMHLFLMNASQLQQGPKERKYFSLIERVGSWHRYQLIVLIIMALINILQASLIFILPYLLNQTPYTCPNLNAEQCSKYVCRLQPAQRNQYLTTPSPFYSLADSLGDFRCQRSQDLSTVQSVTFLGSVFGMGVFTFFTQELGRKKSLILSLLLGLLGFYLIYYAGSIPVLAAGVFIAYAGIQNAYQYTYCYSSELIAEKHRILFVNLMSAAYSLGMMINSFTFFGLKDWKIVFFWFIIVPTICIILLIIYFIEKTPIDLLASENSQQVEKALKRIASINGIQQTGITKQEIQALKLEYKAEYKDQYFTPVDIIKFKSLRLIAIPLVLSNFISNYIFYAPSFIQKNQQADLYKDNIISGLSFLLASLFTQILLLKCQRRKANFLLTALSALFAALMMLDFVSTNSALKSSAFFLFRLFVSIYFNITYILNFESFPTQIRACAANTAYIFAELSGVIEPWTFALVEQRGLSVNLLFIFSGMLGFIVNYWLKQTFGCPPPEIIEQLQHSQFQKVARQR